MNNFRNDLLSRMINIYGFEHPIVVHFCNLCEEYPDIDVYDHTLETLVKCHEVDPQLD